MRFPVLALALCAAMSAPAQAQFAVTADVGSTGVGAHIIVPMEPTLNGRFGANYFKHSSNMTAGSVEYDVKTTLQTIDILFDWYPLQASALHLTAGAVFNGNKYDATGKPNADGNYVIADTPFSGALVSKLNGGIDYRKAAPYLGIGWGNPLTSRNAWSFTADAGVILQGKPNATLASTGCEEDHAQCFLLVYAVQAEKARFVDEVPRFKAYPVLRMGLAYRF
ncbi:MAG: hypothetical protein V4508_14400 [Pseudomonadota bacterium]